MGLCVCMTISIPIQALKIKKRILASIDSMAPRMRKKESPFFSFLFFDVEKNFDLGREREKGKFFHYGFLKKTVTIQLYICITALSTVCMCFVSQGLKYREERQKNTQVRKKDIAALHFSFLFLSSLSQSLFADTSVLCLS